MTVIATALKHMLAAGMPHDAIVAAISEMEAELVPQRSKGAIRQERYRRNKASQGDVCDESDENRHPSLSRPPNENNSNPPTHTHPNNNPARESRSVKAKPIAKPDDVSEQVWADFVRHRKAKRAPVSETALAGIRREVAKAGWTLEAALVETIARGWQSFKAEFVDTGRPAANDGAGSFLASLRSGP